MGDIVMDFDVMVDVTLVVSVNGNGLREAATRCGETGADIALASETTDGQFSQFEGCISADNPVLTVKQFPVDREFIHHAEAGTNICTHFTRNVKTGPVRFSREMKHDGHVMGERKMEMADSHMA